MHNVKGLPLHEVSMKSAVPSKKREGVVGAFEYMQWLTAERKISSNTEGVVIRSLMQVSKAPCLYQQQQKEDVTKAT